MPLVPGQRIGPYEIAASIGRGGMGEVWRARDGKLQREVAIKALPEEFRRDPERLARFEREARLLASLNHPSIAAIYGLEEQDGSQFIVMELVPGQTLAERLAEGPLAVEEAIAVAAQVAAGLEAAHGAGIIHRDLKPSNIKLRPDGAVKLLDLGLARAVEPSGAPVDSSLSPTLTTPATRTGVILGTAAYMSPEQARGKPLDRRTDIFSFGSVLYECLTGRQAFSGETVSDTLSAILAAEPDWSLLPAAAPARLRELLRRCLQKDPKRRLHDIADARIEIEEAQTAGEAFTPAPATSSSRARLLWALVGALVATAIFAAMWMLSRREPVAQVPIVRAVLPLPPGERPFTGYRSPFIPHPTLAISPDGRTIVLAAVRDGALRLLRRRLDAVQAEPIQGTEQGYAPFFSPDGQWIGFFTANELKKVPLSGGSALPICLVPPVTAGGSWADDGRIVFTAQTNGPLFAVSDRGGEPRPLTKLDASRGEHAHLFPQALPGGHAILFTLRLGRDFQDVGKSNIAALDTRTGKWRTVLEGSSYARYAAGRLVFLRGSSVFSAPFDPARLQVTGTAVALIEQIAVDATQGTAHFDISPVGTLALLDGPIIIPTTAVLQLDRRGKEVSLPLPPAHYANPRLSPDGKRLAITQHLGFRGAIVVYDRERRNLSTLTPEPGRSFVSVWSPDGKRIAFSRFADAAPELCVKNADGSGEVEALTRTTSDAEIPTSWSPDGRVIAYTVTYVADRSPTRRMLSTDIWLLSLGGQRSSLPWFETAFRETAPAFSPDGKWIVYVSDEPGHPEIFLRPYPGPGAKIKISSDWGIEPAWSRDGRELLYRAGARGEKFLSVEIRTSPELVVSQPRLLFSSDLDVGGPEGREDRFREYDVSRDGSEIIALRTAGPAEPDRRLMIVTNWAAAAGRP
ncbi:MAG: protein kinase domain-containing protein [Acidobacteriota bacterium]